MKLIKISGLINNIENEEGENRNKILNVLVDNAELFFKCGGILTLSDWEELSDIEKEAFLIANRKIKINIEENIIQEFLDKTLEISLDKIDKKLQRIEIR